MPHILESNFIGQDDGLKTPARHQSDASGPASVSRNSVSPTHNTLTPGGLRLVIANLDHADPKGYTANSVPRMKNSEFNKNIFSLTSDPFMPSIPVRCTVSGFDPKRYPIHWRLQCLHVLGRHCNVGNQTYRSSVLKLTYEWQGYAHVPHFTLFAEGVAPAPIKHEVAGLVYTHRPPLMEVPGGTPGVAVQHRDRVVGGHAILTVTSRPPGAKRPLTDYVHIRIQGVNPLKSEMESFLNHLLSERDQNILNAVKGVLIQESGNIQFLNRFEDHEVYHKVRFPQPADPAYFPYVAFDFGVGLTQETRFISDGKSVQYWTRAAWDWQENLRAGFDEFFGKMRHCHHAGDSWHSWMMHSWHNYNGGGPAATAYAQSVSRNKFGRLVTGEAVPKDWKEQAKSLQMPVDAPAAPPWPPSDMSVTPSAPGQPTPQQSPRDQMPRPPAAQPPPQEPPQPTEQPVPQENPAKATPPQDGDPTPQSYTVKHGDTLSGIAVHFKVPLAALAQANNISDPNMIRAGQTLTIP